MSGGTEDFLTAGNKGNEGSNVGRACFPRTSASLRRRLQRAFFQEPLAIKNRTVRVCDVSVDRAAEQGAVDLIGQRAKNLVRAVAGGKRRPLVDQLLLRIGGTN